jgi:hypothetical protein
LSAVGTGAGQNICIFAFFLSLALMLPSFATAALFGSYRENSSISVGCHCLEVKLRIMG